MNGHRPAALKNPAPLYIVGLFSMGHVDFYIFLMPLYCLSLGRGAGEVGTIVGARSALAVFLPIHVGTLMDRFGMRRVTLFFVWVGISFAPVFPLVPWFWPLLLLQIVNGGALSFAWSGSQTLIAQIARGWLQGVVQLIMFSVQARSVGRYRQGSVVGLRQTANRLSAIVIPPIMGAIADWWGMTESFVVLGVALLVICVPIARIARRASQAPAVEAPEPG